MEFLSNFKTTVRNVEVCKGLLWSMAIGDTGAQFWCHQIEADWKTKGNLQSYKPLE